MTAPELDWTVDDLASLPDDLRCELIDGRLVLPSPTTLHQMVLTEVLLAVRVGRPWTHLPVYSVDVAVDRRNQPCPDIVVVHARAALRSPVPAGDVPLVGEILAADTIDLDRRAKF
ncbi:Uma2 family endonuclease [Actinoplanes sp. NPDC000266]